MTSGHERNMIFTVIFLSVLMVSCWCVEDLSFPPGLKFGVATSAYQIEGGWNASDKGVSIWDTFVHDNPGVIADGSTGDVACDSYHLWRRDVEIAAELGLNYYRFSLAWTRILPTGYDNYVSKDGTRYYSDLIDGLLEKGIESVVTLYHFDLPQSLQNLGGWTNLLMADYFADYARVVFALYGDRVKTWLTFNEPLLVCDAAYNMGTLAPGIVDRDRAMYLCNKNILIAHAKAWRIYDLEFRAKYKGAVSLANQLIWYDSRDKGLAELTRQYANGRYSHPIYSKEGGWPSEVELAIANKSTEEGYSRSKMPAFTEKEKELVRGTYDFYGLNYYLYQNVRAAMPGEKPGPWPFKGSGDMGLILTNPPKAEFMLAGVAMVPKGLRLILNWIREQYGDVRILITENGYAGVAELEDRKKVNFFRSFLKQLHFAIKEDGINVIGYTAWSLMDNFEWARGYKDNFGLYAVNFSSPERTRTRRLSADFYSQVIATHSLNGTLNL